ncbi:DUF1848 domain-containing protein [Algihabitans albus]|uniref:DUF1848 domain-containing protein n=1 Tax=Algihabitans albus TaxID=2164067 RepID=UPI000E5D6836|nr:DUF1848 domain-containing protein [Algihabitans albus]
MIVSASYRTDIPAFYADWFLRRLEMGHVQVKNPYGGPDTLVPLRGPECDGFVFWTRNLDPFWPALAEVRARALPFVVQFTLTGYPKALEPAVISETRGLDQLRKLVDDHGGRTAVWRYDPVFATDLTPPAWHRETFARLVRALAGSVDEVVLSFAQIYAKTRRNTERAAARHGFAWQDPPTEEKRVLLGDLAEIARSRGLTPSLCSQPELLTDGGLFGGPQPARCIDAGRLSDVARAWGLDGAIAARTKGNRPGCLCAESRDIGAYDTCPHGCTYCYAVRAPDKAKAYRRRHDPQVERLGD